MPSSVSVVAPSDDAEKSEAGGGCTIDLEFLAVLSSSDDGGGKSPAGGGCTRKIGLEFLPVLIGDAVPLDPLDSDSTQFRSRISDKSSKKCEIEIFIQSAASG